EMYPPLKREAPFLFSHHPQEGVETGWYNLAGHVHPSVFLRGAGRQRLKLPCFYFGEDKGILPAFGYFTGSAVLHPGKKDRIYVIANDSVIPAPK
ncbi:MAG: hypothetical protein R3350_09870, partial [Saprospiraceae bacterium]|nr:hypothetical protein [Saprospiraceae bacterium]